MRKTILIFATIFFAATTISAAAPAPATPSITAETATDAWKAIDSRPVPAWFEDAKFGIFIHWGLYSVPSYSPAERDKVGIYDRYAEHYWNRLEGNNTKTRDYFTKFHNSTYGPNFRYQDFAPMFKAELYQPDDWARILEDSGAKYVVLTSKHHEGWCLWPSKYSPNWNAGETGPHRDILGDLTASVKARGLKMGYYYSLLEWFHPFYNEENLNQYIDQHMFPQMKELVESYSPDIFWTDGEWDYNSDKWRSTEFLTWLFNESKVRGTVAVNDRWGKETRGLHGGYYTTEYGLVGEDAAGAIVSHPWEECRGIGGSFGFNRNEYLDEYSTSEKLVHLLVSTVARGGNLLLNIGPTADGRIPVIMQQRLRDMGDWLRANGEAIYGTRKATATLEKSKFQEANGKENSEPETYLTQKQGAVYVIMTKWQDGPIVIKGLKGRVKGVNMLGYNGKVRYSRKGDSLTISPVDLKSPNDLPCRYAWTFKIKVEE